jgi:small-conductance mechanosensitive channel
MQRNHIRQISVFIVSFIGALALLPCNSRAQLPGAGDLIQSPTITIGKTKGTADKVQKVVSRLEERERSLQGEQTGILTWKDDLDHAVQRLTELQALNKETEALLKAAGASEGKVDPALLPQLDATTDLCIALADTLTFQIETFTQEQREVGEGLRQGRRLLRRLEAGPLAAMPAQTITVDEIIQYQSDMNVARVALSLLKARRAGLNEELDKSQKDEKAVELKLEPLVDFGGDQQSRQTTLALRQEAKQMAQMAGVYREQLRKRVAGHIEAQLERVRLDIYERGEELEQLEQNRQQLYGALAVSDEDLGAAQERLKAAISRISAEEKKVRRELKQMRLDPPAEEEAGTFTKFKQWQVGLTVLQHQLYLLDVEQQLEKLRAASVIALQKLTEGEPTPVEFHENFAYYLDSSRQRKARDELSTRREAWRQEYAHLSVEEPPPGREELAAAILDGYQSILDLYDQLDARKWEMEWCAELVRHYQGLYELSQRDALWYIWRIGVSLLMLAVAIFLSFLLGRWTLRPIRKRPNSGPMLRVTMFLCYFVGVILLWTFLTVGTLTNVWGSLFGFDRIGEVFSVVLFTIGDREITLYAFASLGVVIAVTVLVNRLIGRFLEKQIFPYFTWDLGIHHAIQAVIKYLVLFGGFALGLEFVGIGFGALALFAGVIGIGIGFGLQNLASNFISGITILFERPIKKGDFVDAGGLEGRVEEIRTRATTLVTRDKVSVIVPNSEFIGGRVVNWSHGTENVRLHVPVGVAYGSDVKLVTELLQEVARKHPKVLARPGPEVWFMGFGDSSLNFELLIWTDDVEEKYQTISSLNYAIDAIFRDNQVTIPFPQRDLHIRSDHRGGKNE